LSVEYLKQQRNFFPGILTGADFGDVPIGLIILLEAKSRFDLGCGFGISCCPCRYCSYMNSPFF
jgi:hypothetical protein